MATEASSLRALEVAESLRGMGPVEIKRFFGGASLCLAGVQFAFVMKGTLYLRADEGTRKEFEDLGSRPFSYATRAGRVTVASYYETPADVMDDATALRTWAAQAHRAALQARPKAGGRRAAGRSESAA